MQHPIRMLISGYATLIFVCGQRLKYIVPNYLSFCCSSSSGHFVNLLLRCTSGLDLAADLGAVLALFIKNWIWFSTFVTLKLSTNLLNPNQWKQEVSTPYKVSERSLLRKHLTMSFWLSLKTKFNLKLCQLKIFRQVLRTLKRNKILVNQLLAVKKCDQICGNFRQLGKLLKK